MLVLPKLVKGIISLYLCLCVFLIFLYLSLSGLEILRGLAKPSDKTKLQKIENWDLRPVPFRKELVLR